MKVPTKVIIGLSVGVGVIVLLAVGFLLVRGILQLNASDASLQLAKKKLKELYDKKPFPSAPNIAREKANGALLDQWYQKLASAMREKQIEPIQMSPSQFKSLLQSKKPELVDLANAGGKVVDAEFGFGFERYFSSSMLPEPGDVPRLAQQLKIVEEICHVLFSERIESLNTVMRETFERGPDDAGDDMSATGFVPGGRRRGGAPGDVVSLVNRNAGVLKTDDLYTKFHFIINFRAKEKALWAILNKLSTHRRVTKDGEEIKMFVVVTGVDMVKEASDLDGIKAKIPVPVIASGKTNAVPFGGRTALRAGEPAFAEDAATPNQPLAEERLTKEQRVVCGPDFEKPLKIKLDLDVYRFRGE